jgi:nitroreductase
VTFLHRAADYAVLAPSVHNTQPWRLDVHPDRLEIRADRSRQLTVMDPTGRELTHSVGAALFNARVALAAHGWGADVERLPIPGDPDLVAVVRPSPMPSDAGLAALAPAVPRRHTNRRAFSGETVPDAVVRDLVACAAAEGALLIPVLTDDHRRLVARLAQQADRLQNADPAYRAELRHWTTRRAEEGDGVPAESVPHVDGQAHDDVPIRDFDTTGTGGLPAATRSGADQTMFLLATDADQALAWLRCGEAMQRVLLELTMLGWGATPLSQIVEVPLTRTQLRSALAWQAHPQTLMRVGHAAPTPPTPRRTRADVVVETGG